MSVKTNLAKIGLGALLALASAGAASAATTNHGTAVHARPFAGSHIVNYLSRGTHVRIQAVSRNWCEVSIPGPDGWVRCSALGNYPSRYFRPGITFNFGFGFPSSGPHMGWWWNDHTGSWWDHNNDSGDHDHHHNHDNNNH
jgi:SH3 domain-containing protein